jgi:ribosomal protein S6
VPSADEATITKVAQAVRAAVEKNEAEIISEGAPSRMRLAYTIERASAGHHEKFDEAYFGFIKFATERENIPALESFLRGNRDVLRFLLTETVREDLINAPRRATFASDRLEGETIKKPVSEPEKGGEVSEADLDKSLDALVS